MHTVASAMIKAMAGSIHRCFGGSPGIGVFIGSYPVSGMRTASLIVWLFVESKRGWPRVGVFIGSGRASARVRLSAPRRLPRFYGLG